MALPAQAINPRTAHTYGQPARLLGFEATMWTDACLTWNDHVVLNAGWLLGDDTSYTLTVFVQKEPNCVQLGGAFVAFGTRETWIPPGLPDTFGAVQLVDPVVVLPMPFVGDLFGWQAYQLDVTMPRPIDHAVQAAVLMNGTALTTKGVRMVMQ
jgi:hypothetical protein